MWKYWIIAGWLVIHSIPRVVGQTVEVFDKKNATPVSDVFIFDSRHTHAVITNQNGKADLGEFHVEDTLVFQHPSYRKVITSKWLLKQNDYKLPFEASVVQMPVFVFSHAREAENIVEVPQKVEYISTREIEFSNAQNSADLLRDMGNISVQKSQLGGGSPVIRGFEANRILLVLDGVRMNNAIYRSGHLQNSITIDNSALEHIEVLYGPGSVVYGSDALGGVIHFYTHNPELAHNDTNIISAGTFARYASVNNEYSSGVHFNLGYKNLGFYTHLSASRFNDLKMGKNRTHGYDDFGKIFHYAKRIDGKDSMMVNPDPNLHINSGYDQVDALQKIMYRPSDKLCFTLNTQYSTSSDIPRYDKLNDYKNGVLKYADWHYGPQKRALASMLINLTSPSLFFDKANALFAYQNFKESRVTRKFNNDFKQRRSENVTALNINLDMIKTLSPKQKLHYGIEGIYNDVSSTAQEENILTGEMQETSTRYPDGGSVMKAFAAYINHKIRLLPKIILNSGIRYNLIAFHSDFINTSFVPLPFSEVDIENAAFNGSVGITARPGQTWRAKLLFSSGFRSPNVDDYGKVFSKNEKVVVPNDDLKPEFAYNADFGVDKSFLHDKIKLAANAFYTILNDAIVRKEYTLNGNDSMMIDGEMNLIQANVNANRAHLFGYGCGFTISPTNKLSFVANYNYTFGYDDTNAEPLGHIPPAFGKVSVKYRGAKWNCVLFSDFNGEKPISLYNLSGVDNESEATDDGTPAWFTLNLSNSLMISDKLELQFGVFNILDQHYKPFASGISGPGRNFTATLRASI